MGLSLRRFIPFPLYVIQSEISYLLRRIFFGGQLINLRIVKVLQFVIGADAHISAPANCNVTNRTLAKLHGSGNVLL